MQKISSYVYTFDKENKSVAAANPGDILQFETMDCFSNRITSEKILMSDLGYTTDYCNPAAGPIYVNSAEPGDVLVVEILEIEVADHGIIAADHTCGPLYQNAVERSKVIPVKDGNAYFNQISFPIDPMIGVIGTAPDREPVINGHPGNHGGNLDCRLHKKGSRIYLPVRVSGALLQMGDVHAAMGDGELCGTGIEIPALITVKIDLIKNFYLEWPVTETKSHWYVNACDSSFDKALMKVSKEMQRLLMRITGWDETDAYMYLSIQGNVEIDQACVPCSVPMIIRIGIPKNRTLPPLVSSLKIESESNNKN